MSTCNAAFPKKLSAHKAESMTRELRALDVTFERLITQVNEQGQAIETLDRVISEQRKLISCLLVMSEARSGDCQPRGVSSESAMGAQVITNY
ncbi:hypothetical protein BBAD15_g7470 [Beauveria bassiana D1-5]|uniref:Uncharacterized protein n=1 Tax=Beauveria bassiana D1-5 TaxID=1245745 RepID=A0A0A2VM63_BEABA|nr:hypothetical protein BBAD15_g7470 [Beauveria bassiana D1-5]